jgi:hypothetical protein
MEETELMGITMIVLMTLSVCRLSELVRATADESMLESRVLIQETETRKASAGAIQLRFREEKNADMCPIWWWKAWKSKKC